MTFPPIDERLGRCYQWVRETLLAERNDDGHWTGELSTSPLSTATAVMALEMVRRDRVRREARAPVELNPLISRGIAWLAEHQNADGGWGDTVKSVSNISTTMLVRASFHAAGADDQYHRIIDRAACYIDRVGGIEAVVARYGKDRTFSVPILTHCALAGLIEWRDVLPLPFELACVPARFYKTVRLPVVSYALPALIAIGQVRYHHRRPWNPLWRAVRRLALEPSLRVLERIQPQNGGFLEATPLTSFVTMSLAGMGRSDHVVARRGVRFLIDSVRPDGSWAIDTNLATWVTTLSVNALGDDLPDEHRPALRDWLLAQQYREVHPYTNADPGGWAWTNLPGGVPDADDTPGAILALLNLSIASGGRQPPDPHGERASRLENRKPEKTHIVSDSQPSTLSPQPIRELTPPTRLDTELETAIANGFDWLLGLQNRDGGFPTFCRGWGTLPFDRSAPDITAHCLRAIVGWIGPLSDDVRIRWGSGARPHSARAHNALQNGFQFLQRSQRPDGSWLPLWFGNQHAANDENPLYGTARVLAAYRDAERMDTEPAQRGLRWLKNAQNADGGWGGSPGLASTVEESALAAEILLSIEPDGEGAQLAVNWLLDRVEDGAWREPSPIGFYFAKLWYFERLYPLSFTVAALRRACLAAQREPDGRRQTRPQPTATE